MQNNDSWPVNEWNYVGAPTEWQNSDYGEQVVAQSWWMKKAIPEEDDSSNRVLGKKPDDGDNPISS